MALGGCFPVEVGMAAVWALLFYIGSIYAVGQATFVFIIALILFTVGAKNKLGVREDSLWTAVKTYFCAPCMIGQIRGESLSAYAREAQYDQLGSGREEEAPKRLLMAV